MSDYAKVQTEAITLADTETSFVLPREFSEYTIKLRNNAILKLAYAAGDIAAGDYITIGTGSSKTLNGRLGGRTIYFTSSTAVNVLEIETIETR